MTQLTLWAMPDGGEINPESIVSAVRRPNLCYWRKAASETKSLVGDSRTAPNTREFSPFVVLTWRWYKFTLSQTRRGKNIPQTTPAADPKQSSPALYLLAIAGDPVDTNPGPGLNPCVRSSNDYNETLVEKENTPPDESLKPGRTAGRRR